jgi:hypothetical protein
MAIYGPSILPTTTADSPNAKVVTTASTEICAANPARLPGSYILNGTNKAIYVAWGVPAVAAAPSTLVPAGGAIDVPHSFVGAINAIGAAGVTGSATTHEFTA